MFPFSLTSVHLTYGNSKPTGVFPVAFIFKQRVTLPKLSWTFNLGMQEWRLPAQEEMAVVTWMEGEGPNRLKISPCGFVVNLKQKVEKVVCIYALLSLFSWCLSPWCFSHFFGRKSCKGIYGVRASGVRGGFFVDGYVGNEK